MNPRKERLLKLLQEKGVPDIATFSRKCGVNRMTLYSIFSYGRDPSFSVILRVISGLGLSTEEAKHLFFEQEQAQEKKGGNQKVFENT